MRKLSFLLVFIFLFVSLATGCNNRNGGTGNSTPVYVSYESQFDDVTYQECIYILNKNTRKFHYKDCYTIDQMSQKNKVYCDDERSNIIEHNYKPCKKSIHKIDIRIANTHSIFVSNYSGSATSDSDDTSQVDL